MQHPAISWAELLMSGTIFLLLQNIYFYYCCFSLMSYRHTLGNVCDLHWHKFLLCYLIQSMACTLMHLTMQKERDRYGERERERGGELGMNFKYLWPNLQGIDQALPS